MVPNWIFSKSHNSILEYGVFDIFIEIADLILIMENSIIHLNDIADLYDEFYLIEDKTQIPPKENEKIKKSLNFLGGYKSGFLWVYNQSDEIEGIDKEMINNLITNALKLSWDNFAVLNLASNEDYTIIEIIEQLKPSKIILWGTGKPENRYQIIDLNNSKILGVESVSVYHTNQELKRKLWENIQLLNQSK